VARLIDAARFPCIDSADDSLRTGLRRAELARFKMSDIDSQRIGDSRRGGKGRKDGT